MQSLNNIISLAEYQGTSEVYASAQRWFGKAVSWVRTSWDSIPPIDNSVKGQVMIVAAHAAMLQLAFRLAQFISPGDTYSEHHAGHFAVKGGPVFLCLYGIGVYALVKGINAPFNGLTLAALHITGFAVGIISVVCIDGLIN